MKTASRKSKQRREERGLRAGGARAGPELSKQTLLVQQRPFKGVWTAQPWEREPVSTRSPERSHSRGVTELPLGSPLEVVVAQGCPSYVQAFLHVKNGARVPCDGVGGVPSFLRLAQRFCLTVGKVPGFLSRASAVRWVWLFFEDREEHEFG